ncbi:YraN family protein [Litoreibacter roseus]|uniref:UPF0102 protein KIN_03900 n=1 Tax=Litoreibacter roseus TaxID=2601869 RepID=A0A6N6JB01_9RHOB|nr:YraN family protein [Litoreibacter roseus]GFE63316.1 UPF0102 protein [Litoreibacter roseus]
MSGQRSYHAGLQAERSVARQYLRAGYTFVAHRYRSKSGEIDLVLRQADTVIFVEIKQSKTHARAADHLSERQISRLYDAASEFLGGEPAGQLTNTRFDVALVDGDGMIEILENAFAG